MGANRITQVVLVGVSRVMAQTAMGLDVEDGIGPGTARHVRGRDGAGRGVVLGKPASIVVDCAQVVRPGVEPPDRRALASAGGEGHGDAPDTTLTARGVPRRAVPFDTAFVKSCSHPGAQGLLAARSGTHDDPASQSGHVVALGKDGPFVAPDLLHGPAAAIGNLGAGEAGADELLHLARAQTADLDLQLTQAGAIAPGGGPQSIIDGQPVTGVTGISEQDVFSVVLDADEAKVAHLTPTVGAGGPVRHYGATARSRSQAGRAGADGLCG